MEKFEEGILKRGGGLTSRVVGPHTPMSCAAAPRAAAACASAGSGALRSVTSAPARERSLSARALAAATFALLTALAILLAAPALSSAPAAAWADAADATDASATYTWTDANGNALDEGLDVSTGDDGDTITVSGSGVLTLTGNTTADLVISEGAEATLDLNGFTLTGTGTTSVVTVEGSLVLKDGTAGEPVEVEVSDLPESVYADGVFSGQSLADTDEDGNLTGTYTTYYSVSDYTVSDDGEYSVTTTYYSYTSGAITGGTVSITSAATKQGGGGIHVGSSSATEASLVFESGTVCNNLVTSSRSAVATKQGGGGILVAYGSFSMTGGVIANNTLSNVAGGAGLLLIDSAEGNSVTGGVICNNSVVDNSSANNYGGGIGFYGSLSVSGVVISGNTAGFGGGIALYANSANADNKLVVESSTICGNTANNSYSSNYAYGGGIAATSAGSYTYKVSLTDVDLVDNYAEGLGGGLFCTAYSAVTLTDSVFVGNETEKSGGGLYGGYCDLSVVDSVFANNAAASYGGAIYLEYCDDSYSSYGADAAAIGGVTMTGNSAKSGGGFACSLTTATISGTTITGNSSTQYGGGVYLLQGSNSSTLSLADSTIADNAAASSSGSSSYGGGIFVGRTSTCTVDGCSITGNSASYGGGVYVASSSTNQTGGTFSAAVSDDAASNDGTSSDESSVSSTSVIANNTASTAASDVYAGSLASIDLSGVDNSSTVYEADGLGNTIDGWYNDASGVRYVDGNVSEVTSTETGSTYTLIAAYQYYSVTYTDGYSTDEDGAVQNDGLGAILGTYTGAEGASIPVLVDEDGNEYMPTRVGYAFIGWALSVEDASEDASADATIYTSLEGLTVTGGTTLTAQWEPIEYTVAYDANGGENAPDSLTLCYDKAGSVTSEAPTREGYSFAGWNTAADGSGTSYEAGDELLNLASEDGATITLYAQWTAKDAIGEFTAQTYTYDGSAQAFDLGDYGSLEGWTITYADSEGNAVESPTDAGSYTVSISRDEDDDYQAFSQTLEAGLVIVKAATTTTASDLEAAYDGSSHAVTSYTVVDQYNKELEDVDVNITYTSSDGSSTSEAPVDVGTYSVTVTYAGSDNYEASSGTCTLVITEAELGFSAEGYSGVYDGAAHSITVTADDADATVSYSTDGETYSSESPAYADVGSYTVYYRIELENYATVTGSCTVEITAATLTATYAGETVEYGSDPVLEVTVEGFVGGETAETAAGYVAPSVSAADATAEGSYELLPAGGSAQNYSFVYVSGTLVVTHCLSLVDGMVPTCTEDGSAAYYLCSGCGQLFSADDGATEVAQEDLTLAATGHDWDFDDIAWTWTQDEEGAWTATATVVCGNDESHVWTVEATVTAASEDEDAGADGGTTYTATALFDSDDAGMAWNVPANDSLLVESEEEADEEDAAADEGAAEEGAAEEDAAAEAEAETDDDLPDDEEEATGTETGLAEGEEESSAETEGEAELAGATTVAGTGASDGEAVDGSGVILVDAGDSTPLVQVLVVACAAFAVVIVAAVALFRRSKA